MNQRFKGSGYLDRVNARGTLSIFLPMKDLGFSLRVKNDLSTRVCVLFEIH